MTRVYVMQIEIPTEAMTRLYLMQIHVDTYSYIA